MIKLTFFTLIALIPISLEAHFILGVLMACAYSYIVVN